MTFLNFVLLVFLILKRKVKRGEGKIENLLKNTFFFRMTEAFQEGLEKIIKEEMEKIMAKTEEEIKKATEKFIEDYKKTCLGIYQGIDISGAKFVSEIEKEKEKFSKKVEEIGKSSLKAQEEILNFAKSEISKLREKSLQSQNLFSSKIKEKIEESSKTLSKEFSQILKSIAEDLKREVAKAEKEIENYKNERLKEVDERIYKMLGEVAKKTIGKAIDLSTHEELVMEALRKAKKEFF